MAHQPEPFWQISLACMAAANGTECKFQWARERAYDQHTASILYEACLEEPEAVVLEVALVPSKEAETGRLRPLPKS